MAWARGRALGTLVLVLMGSCAGEPDALEGLDRGERAVGSGGRSSRVLASTDRYEIGEGDMLAGLLELGGGEVLREIVLDRELDRLARERGLDATPDDLRRERQRLARTLLGERGDLDEERAGRVLEHLRAQRGLGAVRFEALVRRNAMLRRLVRDEVSVREEDVRRAFEIVYGERIAARLIVVADEREAGRIRGELLRGPGDLPSRFAVAARASSIDPSGVLGGQLPGVSPIDPAYPEVLRRALATGEVGTITPVLALDGAYAIALIEGRLAPAPTTFERERGELERVLRERREREAMAGLAERLVRDAGVVVIDRSLAWSWNSIR